MKTNQLIAIVAVALAIAALAIIAAAFTKQLSKPSPPIPNEPDSAGKNFCSPESRKANLCIEIYHPVCGWFDPSKLRCFKYPCAQTFQNSCFACKEDKVLEVLYWTEGECPQ